MKNSRKLNGILLFILSIILLVAGIVCEFVSFFIFFGRERYYVYSALIIIFAGLLYAVANKLTKCEDGYTSIQAFMFYKKCIRAGVVSKPDKLNKKEIDIISEIASEYEYCKEFTVQQKKQLYKEGFEISRMLK